MFAIKGLIKNAAVRDSFSHARQDQLVVELIETLGQVHIDYMLQAISADEHGRFVDRVMTTSLRPVSKTRWMELLFEDGG
nr:hypothetical protein [Algicola sagamiensis]